jgi:hypothetical protein
VSSRKPNIMIEASAAITGRLSIAIKLYLPYLLIEIPAFLQ